ncbi:MAG TPA: GFA family protein [Gammaproteobacteria bacterium]|nr:GFA family protein [Gammaproteobacteria bacterium]
MYTGSCLCGGITFRIEGPLQPIQVCHCSQCRKAQGSPLVTVIPVSRSAFTLVSGEDLLQAYESSPGKNRVFCRRCASPIYSERENLPDVIRIRAGTLDGDLDTRPMAHFYTAYKANWWPITDDLPKFPERYEPGPGRS